MTCKNSILIRQFYLNSKKSLLIFLLLNLKQKKLHTIFFLDDFLCYWEKEEEGVDKGKLGQIYCDRGDLTFGGVHATQYRWIIELYT